MSQPRIPIKQFLRWGLVGVVLFFLGQALWKNWQTVAAVKLTGQSWGWLTIGLFISLMAHCLAGAIWTDILRLLQIPKTYSAPKSSYAAPTSQTAKINNPTAVPSISARWGIPVYLTTNIAKYLPGNVWHFYGRFNACKQLQVKAGDALLSILLEPLLMAAAGLVVAISMMILRPGNLPALWITAVQPISLAAVLIGIHPQIINRILRKVGGAKRRQLAIDSEQIPQLQQYPSRAFMGELMFVLLRGTGFVLTWQSIHPLGMHQLPNIYSSFAIAWLLGLIVPGLPGGIGLFEAVMLSLLNTELAAGELLVIVALYRVINTLAEALGAGAGLLIQTGRQSTHRSHLP